MTLEIEKRCSEQIQTTITFTRMTDCVPTYIETLVNENGCSYQIQTTITFYSDVRLCLVIYLPACNWKWKLVANSNRNNFLLGCPIKSRNISRCWNWKRKLVANANHNNIQLRFPIKSRIISRCSILKTEVLSKF